MKVLSRPRNRARDAEGAPNPVDVHVGKQLRLRRLALGMSQDRLSTAVGITFQQVQKYERGSNRISASRLYDFSRVLGVPVSYFFDTLGVENAPTGLMEETEDFVVEPVIQRDTHELMRIFASIKDSAVRRHVLGLVKTIVASYKPSDDKSAE